MSGRYPNLPKNEYLRAYLKALTRLEQVRRKKLRNLASMLSRTLTKTEGV